MKISRLIIVLITLLGAYCALADTYSSLSGGSGGSAFTLRCPAGSYVVGMEGRYGAWLDAIAPVCAPLTPAGDFGSRTSMPLAGGTGGGWGSGSCPPGQAIGHLTYSATATSPSYVDEMTSTCGYFHDLAGGEFDFGARQESSRGLGVFFAAPFRTGCSLGQLAVGFYGRAGAYVDALGLICDEPPTAPPPVASAPAFDPARMQPRSERAGSSIVRAGGGNAPDAPAPAAPQPVRHERPLIRSDAGEMVRLDYCLNFAEDCGEPAASAFCAATDASRPRATDAPLDYGIGRTFTIGDRELCVAPNCSGFHYVVCAAP